VSIVPGGKQHVGKVGGTLSVGDSLPTWQDVEAVRAMSAGPNAKNAVKRVLRQLEVEALAYEGGIFKINPRRKAQWSRILYRYAAYLTGLADFPDVPAKAKSILRHCYPLIDAGLAAKWDEVASASSDPVAGAINGMLQMAYQKFKDVKNRTDAANLAMELGRELANFQRQMDTFKNDPHFKDDPRLPEAWINITNAFSQVVNGSDPTETFIS
jgi:hypothetical protein